LLTCDEIVTPFIEPYNTSVYAQYTIQVKNRDCIQEKLKENNIPTAVHYPVPLNKQPVMEQSHLYFPMSEKSSECVCPHTSDKYRLENGCLYLT